MADADTPATVDPAETAILASIGTQPSAPVSTPAADPNEQVILGSIQNHGNQPGRFGGPGEPRSAQDLVLSGMSGLDRMRAGVGKWFEDTGRDVVSALGAPQRLLNAGTTLATGGQPVPQPNVSSNPTADAALASDPAGGFGNDIAAVIPSLAGGTAGAEAAAPLAEKIGLKGFLGWLAKSSARGAGAGAGAGAGSPADTGVQRLENTAAGAATGALAGPAIEGGVNTVAAVPDAIGTAISGARSWLGKLKPAEIEQMVAKYLNEASTQTPEEAQAAISASPTVPGVSLPTAPLTDDPGLYPVQALIRGKSATAGSGTEGQFQQSVSDNDAALRDQLNKFAPNASNVQVSTAAVDSLKSIEAQQQGKVAQAYAPFDAAKSQVHLDTSTVLSPADDYYGTLSTAERDMLPSDILKRIYNWDEYTPFNEVEGEMSALGNAASNAYKTGNNNAGRIISAFRSKLDSGIGKAAQDGTIYDANGEEIGNFSSMNADAQGQAPMASLMAGRAANVAYRQRFPSLGGDNTPPQQLVAKAMSGDIVPSEVLDRVTSSPENTAAFLKAAGDDPSVSSQLQNHAVNNLLEASRGQAGQLDGTKLIRNIASNREIFQQFFTPAQMAALDTISNAARVNNAAMRRALPGESATAVLNSGMDNMADFAARAAMPIAEHTIPGFDATMKLLSHFKSGATQQQFDSLLTKALLDPQTYIRLRNMPVNQNTVGIVKNWMLKSATPKAISLGVNAGEQKFGTSAAQQTNQ